ncbi:MAG: hypothetical protein ACREEE_16560 [Dongiaceae bacterium]
MNSPNFTPDHFAARFARCQAVAAGLSLLAVSASAASPRNEIPFTEDFPIESCSFQTTGKNPYFILDPGRTLKFDNLACFQAGDCDEFETLAITVLNQTKSVTFVQDGKSRTVSTRIVKEEERVDGKLKEISRNYFAQCAGNQDVYYFGEDVDIYDANGVNIVSHDGAWLVGKNQAEAGIIMPGGAFLLGSRYFQEIAPGVALDRAEHVAMDIDLVLPYGELEDCVEIRETTPLDPNGAPSIKFYCQNVGLVIDNDLELVDIVE